MFAQIRKMLGLNQRHGSSVEALCAAVLESIKPVGLPSQVTCAGEVTHAHSFERVPWDAERLGPDTTDFDEDHGTPIEFPMCTSKTLYRCACGEEMVRSNRGLI